MKYEASMRSWLAISTLIAAGYADIASADTQAGALGKQAEASDVYQVTCFDDGRGIPARLDVQVRDLLPVRAPRINVQVQKDSVSMDSTDLIDGDAKSSPLISNNGGAGVYTMTIRKTAKPGKPDKARRKKEIYTLTYHCVAASGEHTGTAEVQTQNQ